MRTLEEIEAEHQRLIKQDKEEIERHDQEFNNKIEQMRQSINNKWDAFAFEKISTLANK